MPTRFQVSTWIAGFGLVVVPSLAPAQDRTEREVVELIVRDGPQARAIRENSSRTLGSSGSFSRDTTSVVRSPTMWTS